jgi:L-threonylcarbamoyladenylate synthase
VEEKYLIILSLKSLYHMKVIIGKNVNISEIVAYLKEGRTLVYPTETCYGLGCDAGNQLAVDAVFDIKKRQRDKSMLVVAPSVSMMMEYVVWSRVLQRIADTYWPGPLSVVANVREDCELAAGVIGNDGTVAFRVSSHPVVKQLTQGLERPLVSTSANIATQESPYDILNVLGMFEGQKYKPDIIIDAGTLPHKCPSTVVKVEGEKVVVLRQGEIVVDLFLLSRN